MLAIHPQFFELSSGLARWLYRVVRKHAGHQPAGWNFTFQQLYAKSGSSQRFSDFARDLRRVIRSNALPEYYVEIYRGDRGDECLHATRRALLAPEHPAREIELLGPVGKGRSRPRV